MIFIKININILRNKLILGSSINSQDAKIGAISSCIFLSDLTDYDISLLQRFLHLFSFQTLILKLDL